MSNLLFFSFFGVHLGVVIYLSLKKRRNSSLYSSNDDDLRVVTDIFSNEKRREE